MLLKGQSTVKVDAQPPDYLPGNDNRLVWESEHCISSLVASGEVDELSLGCIKLDGTGDSLGKQVGNVSL